MFLNELAGWGGTDGFFFFHIVMRGPQWHSG